MSRAARIAASLVLGLAASQPASAAQESLVLRQRAEQLAAEDRCEEALTRAQRARALDPDDARAALVEGRCQLRLGLYADAIDALRRARELDASLPGVSADLAQAHYHLDQLGDASRELDRAEQENPDDARVHLYRGLLLLREAKQEEAAESFDRASTLDPTLAGAASLYSGRSWQGVQDRQKAAAALERARLAAPGSEWSLEAERELERLDAPERRHVWGRARGGVEYDDNVPLRHEGTTPGFASIAPVERGKRHDVRVVWEAEVGAEALRTPERSLGAVAGYRGNAHTQRFNQFDLQNPWISLWYDERLGENTWLRFQPFGSYAWLEKDPFVLQGGANTSLTHSFAERLIGQLFTRVTANEYLFRIRPDPTLVPPLVPPGSNLQADARRRRNRDGLHVEAGLEGSYELAATRTRFTLGSAYDRYLSEGKDWDRHGSLSWLALRQPLPLDLRFDAIASFAYHPYDHRSSHDFAPSYVAGVGGDRLDRIWDVETELTYDITRWLALSARYGYTNASSNVRVFDYDRHVVGGYLTVYLSN